MSEEKIDWSKVSEYEASLNEVVRTKIERARPFDPKELVSRSKRLKRVQDDETGDVIEYGSLTFGDLIEVNKAANNEEKAIIMLFTMLHKAYKDLTMDDVRAFGMTEAVRILNLVFGKGSFLLTQKPSPNGLGTVATPSGSGSSSTPTSFR